NAPLPPARKEDLEPGTYNFRVRSLFSAYFAGQTGDNTSSKWVYPKVPISVVSLNSPPPNITGAIRATIQGSGMVLDWDAVNALNLAYYRVKYSSATDGSAGWSTAVVLADVKE